MLYSNFRLNGADGSHHRIGYWSQPYSAFGKVTSEIGLVSSSDASSFSLAKSLYSFLTGETSEFPQSF